MSTPTPYQESPTATLATPTPTRPVAGRPVETDAPVLNWTPVPDATHYRVQIASTEDFASVHYDEGAERGAAVPLGSVLPDDLTTVVWRVRAEGDDGARSSWSDPARFALPSADLDAGPGPVRVEAAPVALHPEQEQDPPVDQRAVPFGWERVPEATGYQLQVAPTDAFAEPVVDLTVDQTTSVTLYDTLPADGQSLYWRLRPLFRVADPGPWSAPVPFVVAPPVEEADELAPESEDPKATARASGPVTEARTSKALSLTISLLVVLSFLTTIALIILVG